MKVILIFIFLLLSNLSWAQVNKEFIVHDPMNFKGQKRSLIDWDGLNLDEHLDYNVWEAETLTKKNNPLYRVFQREKLLRESVGKIISCIGTCRLYRGKGYVNASFRSKIIEGDDVVTDKDSYAWIFLVDGTLVRIAPHSSISFKEINLTKTEVFYHVRMNEGYLSWISRLPFKLKPSNLEETDPLFSPLRVKEANRIHYRHLEGDFQNEKKILAEQGEYHKENRDQFNYLNKLIEENNKETDKRISRLFLVMPNASIEGQNLQLDLHYALGQKSYLKLKDPTELYEIDEKTDEVKQYGQVYFRGYENVEAKDISVGSWYVMNENGRALEEFKNGDSAFHLLELLVKRIPSIMIVREFWLKQFTPILKEKTSQEQLAIEFGYRLWNKQEADQEMKSRIDFLKEYTRRTETTHLATVNKLNERLEKEEKIIKEQSEFPNPMYYQKSLMAYYDRISTLYDPKIEEALELNRLGYHFWLMINAKGNP